MDKKELTEGKHVINGLRGLEKMHPHKLLTYLFLFGLSLVYSYLLISLTIETIINKANLATIQFPKFFVVASFLIISTMFIPVGIIQSFKQENLFIIRKKIFGLFLLGTIFLLFQGIGWLELIFQGFKLKSNFLGTYLYVITGIHMLSVLIGLGAIAFYLYLTRNMFNDGVAKLIYFTSMYEKTKLEIIHNYWAFVCISWILCVTWLMFLI
jgi:cytochrome c oxidase subunit 3